MFTETWSLWYQVWGPTFFICCSLQAFECYPSVTPTWISLSRYKGFCSFWLCNRGSLPVTLRVTRIISKAFHRVNFNRGLRCCAFKCSQKVTLTLVYCIFCCADGGENHIQQFLNGILLWSREYLWWCQQQFQRHCLPVWKRCLSQRHDLFINAAIHVHLLHLRQFQRVSRFRGNLRVHT